MRGARSNGFGPPPQGVVATQTSKVVEVSQDEYVFSLEAIFRVIRRRILTILLVTAFLTGAATGFSLFQTPTYEASIKILIGQKQEGGASDLGSSVLGLQQLTQTMAAAVNTRPVAETVIKELNLRESPEDFLKKLSVSPVANTQFVEVSYRDTDPRQAQRVADEIGRAFSQRLAIVSPNAGPITATVWERAAFPQDPVSPDPLRNAILALMLGVIFGVTLAFVRERTDDGWSSSAEMEHASGVPTVGLIPTFEAPKPKKSKG